MGRDLPHAVRGIFPPLPAEALLTRAPRIVLRKECGGVSSPVHIIPTGLRLAVFFNCDGVAFRARHGIAPERPVMAFVGRVAFKKNLDFLLRVTEQVRPDLPDVLSVIAGEGPVRASLERAVARRGRGNNVNYIGYLERKVELPACYRAADVFVFASKTETQGLVLLEAMALGVPVVGLAEMGTKDVLRDAASRRTMSRDLPAC
jgi:1,2-diacylglycerol 3-alpha-glucosyltransferase